MDGDREPVRYLTEDEDSGRWAGFSFRPGDIVISTRSKSGTTWMQTICALLVFGTPTLPAPIAELSPWLDFLVVPRDQVIGALEAQTHRRFMKTHTPLDGIPLDPRVTYIVVARHPLDAAVSLYHQGDNLDFELMRRLAGQPEPARPAPPRLDLHSWLVRWIDTHASPHADLDSLDGFMWHLHDAWRRREQPNVVLVHYDDLCADLEDQMRRLARVLEIDVAPGLWPSLVDAASFESMRADADNRVPQRDGVLKSGTAFFRRGRSGAGEEALTGDEASRYYARAAAVAPRDLLGWLHRR